MKETREIWNNVRNWCRGNITLWRLLYWAIAIATFRHSAIGFATLEAGNLWLGALGAVAVDIGMIAAAEKLQSRFSWWLFSGLVLAASGSFYSQELYAVTHADAIGVAPGAIWMQPWAVGIVNLRVVILPLLLPSLAVIYSFANQSILQESQDRPAGTPQLIGFTKKEQCQALALQYPNARPAQIAALVGCVVSTATRALDDMKNV